MRHYKKSNGSKIIIGRDYQHLEHVTNGIKGGIHGGTKKERTKRERKLAKRILRNGDLDV